MTPQQPRVQVAVLCHFPAARGQGTEPFASVRTYDLRPGPIPFDVPRPHEPWEVEYVPGNHAVRLHYCRSAFWEFPIVGDPREWRQCPEIAGVTISVRFPDGLG